MSDKYVAYVSTYTMGKQDGIKIFDVDTPNGRLTLKGEVEITNSSYATISNNKKFFYSITDFGIAAYRILPDGMLEYINTAPINGMRGCYISTDMNDRFAFVAGYHDGKITVVKLNEDGSVGDITDEIYHKGMGSVADRNFRPHINCVLVTKDNHYLCAADPGMDHVNVYRFDEKRGTLKNVDVIRSEQESAPRHLVFTKNGKFLYIIHELKMYIDVYTYKEEDNLPYFEKIQTVSTMNDYCPQGTAASALQLSEDEQYVVSSNAGDNSVAVFKRDTTTGLLERVTCLPVSGEYPKDAALFPDNKHLVSLNHETNTLTFFTTDMEKGLLIMNGKEISVRQPNAIVFHKLA